MDYNNMDIVMIGSDQTIPDEKKPAQPIKIVTKDSKKNHFRIKILHPNKNEEGLNPVLYDKIHRVSPETDDIMEQFDLAQEKATEIIETQFANLETKHEEILHIPAARKGKMQLYRKPKAKESSNNKKEDKAKILNKKAPKKNVAKKSTAKKKITKKKVTKKKTAKKSTAKKKETKKKVAKKSLKKKTTKKKVSKKKIAKKTSPKKKAKKVNPREKKKK